MKSVKLILIAATLLSATVVSNLSAQQEAQPAQNYEFKVAKGDTVMFNRGIERYCTGEEPSKWVYDKTFVVRQLGTKRFPDGVLLMPILSWIHEGDLKIVNGRADQAAAEAAAELAAEDEAAEAAKRAAMQAKQDSIAAARAAEQAEKDSIAAAKQAAQQAMLDSIAAAQALQDSLAHEQYIQDSIANEKAKGDSIHSQQNFKHGYDRFTIGLRGGASALLHTVEQGKWLCGGDVLLDLQYAHYWTKDGRPVDLGLIVGLGLGYSQSGMKTNVNTQQTVFDNSNPAYPMHVDYTVRADEVNEQDGQLQLEIPLMFSLITQRGLFFNIGPKFMLPLYTPYQQTISDNDNTYITAYFEEIGVPVTNEVITGVLAENQYKTKASDNGNQFTINVMLGTELGYEWVLNSGNSFGLGVYANYCLYNSFKNNTENIPLIEVTPPTGDGVAVVDVHSATKTYASKLGYFDVGLKLAYHFNFPKKHKYIDAELFK
ncbi:MAG: hypothetical protein J5884_00095 [Paludibacteraceae bacterium]|nr:hypothetical protein [Paludibacteraceae bacterium]